MTSLATSGVNLGKNIETCLTRGQGEIQSNATPRRVAQIFEDMKIRHENRFALHTRHLFSPRLTHKLFV